MLSDHRAYLRSSIAAGVVASVLAGSLLFQAPSDSKQTQAFLGRWSSEAAALANGADLCTREAGYITFGTTSVQLSDNQTGTDFVPSKVSYTRSGDRLTLAMAMPSPDGEITWNIDMKIGNTGTLNYDGMSGSYPALAEIAYGPSFEEDFAHQWATLHRCQSVALND